MSCGGHTFSSQIVLLSSLISCFAMGIAYSLFLLLLFSCFCVNEWKQLLFGIYHGNPQDPLYRHNGHFTFQAWRVKMEMTHTNIL